MTSAASVQVLAHVIPIGFQVNVPIIRFTSGVGADSRLIMNGDLSSFPCNSVLQLNPFTGRQKAVGFHPGREQRDHGWNMDSQGKLQAAFQGPETTDPSKGVWTIRPVNGGPVLFSYQQDWSPRMLYPTWATTSDDVICCAVRQVLDSIELPRTFLRFRLLPGVAKPSAEHNGDTPHDVATGANGSSISGCRSPVSSGKQNAKKWVKECQVKLPCSHLENLCVEGRVVIQLTDAAETRSRTLIHFDTDTCKIWEIMAVGSEEDFPRPCVRWVAAGRDDPARFIYVAACANNHVVLVDARRHCVLCGWAAASLLQANMPRRPQSDAWLKMPSAQLRRVSGAGKQAKHVDFSNDTYSMCAFAASGGKISLTHF